MNKCLKKIFIVALAVCCALSVQLSVSAIDFGNMDLDDLKNYITNIFQTTTTTSENPDNTTTANDPNNTTTETTTDIVNNSGTGVVTTTTDPTTYNYNTTYYYPTNNNYTTTDPVTTTEPAGDEDSSLSFEASLSDLFEDDTAAVIVQTPTEPFTIGGLVVSDGNDKDDFTWQKAALIAAAVLFVVLLALVVALLIQRSKKEKAESDNRVVTSSSEPSGPVPVEVMTPERIAELLGATAAKNVAQGFENMSGEESAAAIRNAALMGQLNSYSDPLIRKYTDDPVMISPSAAVALDLENATAADVLKATDSMLDDITGDEKYASDISGYKTVLVTEEDAVKKTGAPRICPDCGNSVPADDVFCHNCGTYIG